MVNFYSNPFKKNMQMQSQVCTVTVKISLIVFWISIKGREVPVNKMVDSNCKTNVKKAGETIPPITDTFKLCGRQKFH